MVPMRMACAAVLLTGLLPAAPSGWVAAIQGEVDRRTADGRFSGVALVAHGGTVVVQEARGFLDAEGRTSITIDTRFNLGSMNKMFTAIAVAQLAQAGRLKFDDTVAAHLPDHPNKDVASRVTIHQLLTHTSGTGNIFGPAYEARRDSLHRVSDYMALFAEGPLRFEPGTRWEYSNGGFITLGAIVERVSGQDYYDYVREHVFEPAGMTGTGFFPKTALPPNTAMGQTRGGGVLRLPAPGPRAEPPPAPAGPLRSNLEELPGRGSPAGGGYSTAGDLVRFADALLGHRLLHREYTDLVLAGKVDAPRGKYAYGFSERSVAGRRVVGHNGGFPGVNAELHVLPDSQDVIVVLSNYDPPAASQLAEFMLAQLTGEESPTRSNLRLPVDRRGPRSTSQ